MLRGLLFLFLIVFSGIAVAETKTLTEQEIERMYVDEMKVAGATLQCFQAGQEVVNEPGLQDLSISDDRITATRLDQSGLLVLKDATTLCTIINRRWLVEQRCLFLYT